MAKGDTEPLIELLAVRSIQEPDDSQSSCTSESKSIIYVYCNGLLHSSCTVYSGLQVLGTRDSASG